MNAKQLIAKLISEGKITEEEACILSEVHNEFISDNLESEDIIMYNINYAI